MYLLEVYKGASVDGGYIINTITEENVGKHVDLHYALFDTEGHLLDEPYIEPDVYAFVPEDNQDLRIPLFNNIKKWYVKLNINDNLEYDNIESLKCDEADHFIDSLTGRILEIEEDLYNNISDIFEKEEQNKLILYKATSKNKVIRKVIDKNSYKILYFDSNDDIVLKKLNNLKSKIICENMIAMTKKYIDDGVIINIDNKMTRINFDEINRKEIESKYNSINNDTKNIEFINNTKTYSLNIDKFKELYSMLKENEMYNIIYGEVFCEYIKNYFKKDIHYNNYIEDLQMFFYGYINEEIVDEIEKRMEENGYSLF